MQLMLEPKTYSVYILTNRSKTLYIGVTSRLEARVREHKQKVYPGFTSRYAIDRLVYFERHPTAFQAIEREKELKGWRRDRKLTLIVECNPEWRDLSEEWGKPVGPLRHDLKKRRKF